MKLNLAFYIYLPTFTYILYTFHITASQQAARARASSNQKSSDSSSPFGATISLDEAMKILNIDKLDAEKVQKNYDHLFKINDKAKGGSFYLQSKVSFMEPGKMHLSALLRRH